MYLLLALILNVNLALSQDIGIYWGEKVAVGNGHAQSYIKTHYHRPKELGVILTEGALKNLPQHEMKEYVLPMPEGISVFPYKHITFDWNPHGHEPNGVYDKPHFDIHFYFISSSERQNISCMNEDAAICIQNPEGRYLVTDYAPTPTGVPKMGWHWVDLLSPEFNGGIFTRTFIYGYYSGKPIFIEPMVTLEYLQSKEKSVKEIRMPQVFPYSGGYFPSVYTISYNKKMKIHKIILKKFRIQE